METDHWPGSTERLILFSRYPEPGKTKTRLIPVLGEEGAAGLQRQMTEHALSRVLALAWDRQLEVEVRFEGGSEALMAAWLGPEIKFRPQGEGDLGARMERAFAEAFQTGVDRAVIVGSDCPGITSSIIRAAFDLLDRFDLVLGPAADGGYYLIGLSRAIPPLFREIPWGTAQVRTRTLQVADSLNLEVLALDLLADVDRPEDLPVWERESKSLSQRPRPWLSVVIPALDEEVHLGPTLARLQTEPGLEIIVVDGQSKDATLELAVAHGVRLLIAARGRAGQMHAGAVAANGCILLFLHGDTRLPRGFQRQVLELLARPGVAAGAFRLGIDGGGPGLRLIERLANWRSRLFQLPYGDQAFFMKAELYFRVGGFPELPIMEDFAFIKRLKKHGRILLAPSAVLTSARRWQALGVGRATMINQAILAGYHLGLSPERLARWYHRWGQASERRKEAKRAGERKVK